MVLVHNVISSTCFGPFWAVIREKRIDVEEGIIFNNYNSNICKLGPGVA
jgi:hypothetical protein